MFELPGLTAEPETAIPTLVPAEELFQLLSIIDIEVSSVQSDKEVKIGRVVTQLSIEARLAILELADRFDCEAISVKVQEHISAYCKTRTGLQLLAAASSTNSVKVARLAIARLGSDQECWSGSLYSKWWILIGSLRPDWQIELTKLVWENQHELVNRPGEYRGVHANGRSVARTRGRP